MYFALSNSKENTEWAAKKMTSLQIAEAQRRARDWLEKHPEPPACADAKAVTKLASVPE
jgi:hypothetical protein